MNSEPAFPTNNWQKTVPMSSGYSEGMTLRDYFAAEAISFIQWNKDHTGLCAKKCYEIADAMMKQRKEVPHE